MGTITSSTGLVSGMDIQSLVNSLMQIEARPLEQLTTRITDSREQQVAITELMARIATLRTSIDTLTRPTSFMVRSANSSNEDILRATASAVTQPGNYSFVVNQLVGTHALASNSFVDSDTTPVGPGTMTFEIGKGQLSQSTSLEMLNGFRGTTGGMIEIVDQKGDIAQVDLRTATNLDDILDEINSAEGIRVRAEIQGGAIRVIDESNGTGAMRIRDIGGSIAKELGLASSTAGVGAGEAILGSDLIHLSEDALLRVLNDGNGFGFRNGADDIQVKLKNGQTVSVNFTSDLSLGMNLGQLNGGRGVELGEIKITNKAGISATIDLSDATTLGDVKDKIDASGIDVSMAINRGSVILSDVSAGGGNFIVEDVTGSAAEDLGITADDERNTVNGSSIHRMATLGDVIRAIEFADGNDGSLQAAISDDGFGITLTDMTTDPWGGALGDVQTEIIALNGSTAARDLGLLGDFSNGSLQSRRLVAGANTVLLSSLNGGSGMRTGVVDFTLRDGSTQSVDMTSAQTLQDVIEAINATTGLSAEIDSGGTGIRITDETTGTAVQAVSGDMAEDLHLAVNSSGEFVSGDLQLQYITENTLLATLNGGQGIGVGEFTIQSGSGVVGSLKINSEDFKTIGDVIDGINGLNTGVVARINLNGDGIELIDGPDGDGVLTVTDDTGTVAADLRIAGTAEDGKKTILGSFATTIEIDSNDTLKDMVDKINQSGAGVQASWFSTGGGLMPYRMTVTSKTSGSAGEISFSTDIEGLDLHTASRAQDAKILYGEANAPGAVPTVITSSTNQLQDIIPGLTLDLVKAGDELVSINVERDTDAIVASVQSFIEGFNGTMERLDELTAVNPETGEGGLLQGTRAAHLVQSELHRMITSYAPDGTLEFNRLSDMGIMAESREGGGVRLTMNRTVGERTINGEMILRDLLDKSPDAVKDFFSRTNVVKNSDGEDKLVNVGFAARFKEMIDKLTSSGTGSLSVFSSSIDDRVELYESRSKQLQELLKMKEERLYKQFQSMESALAELQSQQSSLNSLSAAVASFSSNSGSGKNS